MASSALRLWALAGLLGLTGLAVLPVAAPSFTLNLNGGTPNKAVTQRVMAVGHHLAHVRGGQPHPVFLHLDFLGHADQHVETPVGLATLSTRQRGCQPDPRRRAAASM